jgi:hypothetical protein
MSEFDLMYDGDSVARIKDLNIDEIDISTIKSVDLEIGLDGININEVDRVKINGVVFNRD